MDIEYIIVQAGGKGTRLEHLTTNKPKALLPVNNLPMIFHLFKKFPDKKFIIIGDYKKEVLREYLRCFAKVKYIMVDAEGSGTCSGIKNSINLIPENVPFMLIWSDLILTKDFSLPKDNNNYIGISEDFPCRWSYIDNKLVEEKSVENGVAGLFIFKDKSIIEDVLDSGEFVRYLSNKNCDFNRISVRGTKEYGLISVYNNIPIEKCRPFNKITVKDGILIKEGIDEQGQKLAIRERNWYKLVKEKGFNKIPNIYEYKPLKMDFINGKNVYEYKELNIEDKKNIVKELVDTLKELHSLNHVEVNNFSVQEAYINKTFDRLNKIRDLIPFANNEKIIVNGRECRNIFFYKNELEKKVNSYKFKNFELLHGDCTFSNIMLDENLKPVLIDPRGYFGFTEIYGDADYDWAKLYYSIVGNYDRFNIKDFRLKINENDVELNITSNNFEDVKDYFLELLGENVNIEKIKLLHAIIWLSLTTYAWQDYDSICGAFYNGIYYLEEIL